MLFSEVFKGFYFPTQSQASQLIYLYFGLDGLVSAAMDLDCHRHERARQPHPGL